MSSGGTNGAGIALEDKWDKAIERTIRRGMYGAVFGGVAAILLFRECYCRPPSDTFESGARHACRISHFADAPDLPPTPDIQPTTSAGSPSSRSAVLSLGLGCGLGSAYEASSKEFAAALAPFPEPKRTAAP